MVFWERASTEINYWEYFQNPFRKERHIFDLILRLLRCIFIMNLHLYQKSKTYEAY